MRFFLSLKISGYSQILRWWRVLQHVCFLHAPICLRPPTNKPPANKRRRAKLEWSLRVHHHQRPFHMTHVSFRKPMASFFFNRSSLAIPTTLAALLLPYHRLACWSRQQEKKIISAERSKLKNTTAGGYVTVTTLLYNPRSDTPKACRR